MIRVFYQELLHNDPELLEEAQIVASRVYELSQFVFDVLGVTDMRPFTEHGESVERIVTYHEACHLTRELGVVTQPRALMNSLPGIRLVEMEQAEVCCGFGGTFSVKYPDISGAMLQDKVDNIRITKADTLVACDSSCLMQLSGGLKKQGVDVRSMHIAQLLDETLEMPAGEYTVAYQFGKAMGFKMVEADASMVLSAVSRDETPTR